MRCFLLPALLLCISASLPAQAAQQPRPVRADPTASSAERLDKLFSDLKRERNEKAAERIAKRIGEEWFRSRGATIDLLMQWAGKAAEERKFSVALDFLDQITVLEPDYAEGWARRASVHLMMENYGKAMTDINRTLQLEPRHFGALAGMAQILEATGRKELALAAYQRVLDVYPMMRRAQEQVGSLSEELAGQGL